MKLWITGSQGLVGKALQKKCSNELIEFVATSRADVDITSSQHIKKFLHSREGEGITHLINCAAYTNVDEAENEPAEAYQINALGPENLGTVAHHFDLKMVHLSTDYVFGKSEGKPLTETDACRPDGIYAKTKYEGEVRLLDAFPQACVIRTSWVFGQGGKNFVSSILDKIQKETKISAIQDQRNKLTYVDDLAQAILSLLCHSGIFHFANRGETSRYEVAKQMVETAKQRGLAVTCQEIVPVDASAFPQRAKRPLYSALDTTKIEMLLGISPRPWEHAIKEFIHAI